MRLYRAISAAELQDLVATGLLRPGPPSFQGKWFAESASDAVRWGHGLYAGSPFVVMEVEVDDAAVAGWFRLTKLDGIGPARYAEIPDLPAVRFLGVVYPVGGSP